ncbi:phosphotriesterase-related protein [Heyndrickxia oleronia]|uniref:Phosphotriesterase-related protein n=1 Tax=Heyndrickxia oleronia TaxID=38875 RepID=A0AAW6T119_9BACI|nr:phosphotriesterase-related protein [Heyndrickxia oleronia]MCM3240333.1 phosphotriesterase-related protein [Heyndrickxia oleronia]MDH5161946.1 phosphotriesterase-related protein [Heyndrickxia oleronia]
MITLKKIRTLLGDIEPSQLGFTYSHEHLWTNPPAQQKDRDLELTDYEASVSELWRFKKAGGNALVDATTLDYGRNAGKMRQMSIETGVHVIATTGFNKHVYFPKWVEALTIEEITQKLVRDVTIGMDGTSSKAGFLKSGSWNQLIHPLEEKVTRAVARAQLQTGAPIWLHTEAGTMGMEMLDILEEEGIDLSLVGVGHSDRNADTYYHLQLAKRGAYVQFDGSSKIKYYPDSTRVELIKNMIENGYVKQLLISGDMGRQCYLHAYGGGPGFEYIIKKFIPRLLDEGISQEDIHTIFVKNPARWLAQFEG